MPELDIVPIKAFKDNYIWLVIQSGDCLIIDPGDAKPVQAYLQQHQLTPRAILITHRHADHIGGVAELCQHYSLPVYGPASIPLAEISHPLQGGETLDFDLPKVSLQVLATPGHTAEHLVFYGHNLLFCGDTLFSAGCGRDRDGDIQDLYHSLQRLANLPDSTQIYCAHEYTQSNLAFALWLEPDNQNLQKRRVEVDKKCLLGLPSLPNSLGNEKLTNPFLRVHKDSIIQSVINKTFNNDKNFLSIFTRLRRLKDEFKA